MTVYLSISTDTPVEYYWNKYEPYGNGHCITIGAMLYAFTCTGFVADFIGLVSTNSSTVGSSDAIVSKDFSHWHILNRRTVSE